MTVEETYFDANGRKVPEFLAKYHAVAMTRHTIEHGRVVAVDTFKIDGGKTTPLPTEESDG
jgi:hypothetical protein